MKHEGKSNYEHNLKLELIYCFTFIFHRRSTGQARKQK